MKHTIHNMDILAWAASYTGEKYHALLCDPPYHLTEITKRFSKADAAPAQFGTDGVFQRASKGFMGKDWDGGNIAFRPETWAALAEHLHPGAYGMAFASTRGYHRMACAIEDAGLIIHTMMAYSFGSGFPKATRLDTQIDRRAGAEPVVTGTRKHQPKFNAKAQGYREKDNGFNSRDRASFDVTAPATALAQAWQGHRYGGQAIKPAFEPIVIFQKPHQGKPIDSIVRTGAGALNIDAARIGTMQIEQGRNGRITNGGYNGGFKPTAAIDSVFGRWPANLMLVHNPDCVGDCTPGCAVAAMGEMSGESESRQGLTSGRSEMFSGIDARQRGVGILDSGTAARYFFNADYMLDRLDATNPLFYTAKASTSEREHGLDSFESSTVDDGRKKSIDNAYQRGETLRKNTHPTAKPIDLCKHLATLLLPPDYYAPRRLLIPFSGVSSEMIGAGLAGWDVCDGIEREAEYAEIARTRLGWWIDVFGEQL